MKRHWLVLASPFLLLVFLSATAIAEKDPPGRVARVQYVSGQVSVQPQGTGDWVEAVMNRPLTSADNVWADKNSRAEFNVGTAVFRIDSDTSLSLVNVSDNSVQLLLNQGTLNLHVRKLYGGEIYEVRGPNIAFTVQKAGDYRFDVDPNGETTVTVWRGEGDVTGAGRAVHLEHRQSAHFPNDASMAHSISQNPRTDGFDDWCQVRDERIDKSPTLRYVPAEVIGAEDLDDYGYWEDAPTYGRIWVPRVAVGWAPYRYGHWVWISPWGWTWVDDAPWGFAPFHYGRWVYYNDYWAWAPGPYWGRPIYAPALVAWFGGPRWGVSVGFGGPLYGWCPLGWREPFFPWYGVSRGYFHHVNYRVTNINVVTNNYFRGGGHWGHYANSGRPGGFSAMDGRLIQTGSHVNGHLANVGPDRFNHGALGREMPLRASGPQSFGRPGVAPRGGSQGNALHADGPAPMRRGNEGGSRFSNGIRPSVPRPGSSMHGFASGGGGRQSAMNTRSVPRPGSPSSFGRDSGVRVSGGSGYMTPRSGAVSTGEVRGPGGMGRSVPRPTGPVSRDNTSYSGRSSYGRQSYGSASASRNSSPSYGGHSNYGGGGYSVQRGGGYEGRGNYGGGSGAYGGGRSSAPSSGGGVRSGGGGYSGGGHAGGGGFSGGGGGRSGGGHAGGGGGHSGGGGGGGGVHSGGVGRGR